MFPANLKGQARARVAVVVEDARTPMLLNETLITSCAPALANSIGVDSRAATASKRSNGCAFLTTRDAANKCPGTDATRGSQLVAMLLPEASAMFMAIANACVMRMPVVAVPVPQPTAGSG